MKWTFTHSDGRHESYQLHNGTDHVLTLIFHAATGMMRLTANGEKRVFSVRRQGFLRPRTVLRNEYGIYMAQALREHNGERSEGMIELPEETLQFFFPSNNETQLAIVKNGQPLVTCTVPLTKESRKVSVDLLVLTLGWYMRVASRQKAALA